MSDQIDVNYLADALNGKMDIDLRNAPNNIDYVIESKFPTESDPTWYRVYKSGWVEQGGRVSAIASQLADRAFTFNLSKNISQLASFTNHFIYTGSTGNWGAGSAAYMSNTTSTVTIMSDGLNTSSPVSGFLWEVKGIGAQS